MDRLLLIGEGDFSFTIALCEHPKLEHLPPVNITATTFDSKAICVQKYPKASAIINELQERGVNILFEVDGTNLEHCPALKNKNWNHIIWNFPHIGKGISDMDRNINANQLMLLGFLRSAAAFLAQGSAPLAHAKRKKAQNVQDIDDDSDDDFSQKSPIDVERCSGTRGTILITLRNVKPYTEWELPKLAKNPPPTHPDNPKYEVLRSFIFPREEWGMFGYAHRMTKGFTEGIVTGADRARALGKEGGEDRCWELYIANSG